MIDLKKNRHQDFWRRTMDQSNMPSHVTEEDPTKLLQSRTRFRISI